MMSNLSELQLHIRLQRDLKNVASAERLMHVALRLIAPFYSAGHAVVFVRERNDELRIVHQSGNFDWPEGTILKIFEAERVGLPQTMLYVGLRERGKIIALMLLERDEPFSRADLRSLQRLAAVVNEALDSLAEVRVREVLSRIDHKISTEIRLVDLLYQILDGLMMLVRYDHSASILLLDGEQSEVVVRAEKIVWRKLKSPNMKKRIELSGGTSELLHLEDCGFLMRKHPRGLVAATFPLFDADHDPPQASQAALREIYLALCSTCGVVEQPEESCMLLVPLRFGRRPLGLLKLSATDAGMLNPADLLVVGRFIEKIAAAIRNAYLYERRLEELQAINEIGKLVTRPLPLKETCGRILDIVLSVMNLRVGSIELLDRDRGRLRVVASRGYEHLHEGLELGRGLTGEVARTGKPILANDVRQQQHYVQYFADVRSELAVPIQFEGETLGVLNVESYTKNRFRDSDVDFLSILSDKTATALETLDQRERRRATLQLLYDLSGKLSAMDDLQRLMDYTVETTRQHLGCEVASIFLFENGKYVRRATDGLPADWFSEESFSTGEGLTGRAAVMEQGSYPRPVIDNDVEGGGHGLARILSRYREKLRSGCIAHLIAVPLVENERPMGILRIINRVSEDGKIVPGGFTTSDITILSTIASQVSMALADFRKRERIQELSTRLEAQVVDRTEEAHRLARFVESAPLAIFSIRPDSTLDFINEAGERMFGFQAAELVGKSIEDPDTLFLGENYNDLLNIVGFMNRWGGEVECRRADGSSFPAYLSASSLTDTGGENKGIVVFARDLTATKELERQLLESEGKRAMADLAGGVAHDLNNALGSCLPLIQALKGDLDDGVIDAEQFKEDLAQIESYTRLSVRIFKSMLSMARGTFAINQRVDINEPMDTVLNLLAFRLEKASVIVQRNLSAHLPKILAHAGRLEQALHNVVTNAIDAMPEGGTLAVSSKYENNFVVLEIRDSGIGIPKELMDKVQEPFYTSKGHGTGLGLSVVRSIVWEHNGKLELQSEEGVGTSVHMSFPPADDSGGVE